jgi:hypothetical protein
MDHNVLGPYFENLRGVFRPSLFVFDLWNQFHLNMYIVDGYVSALFQSTPFSWFMETFVLASDAQIMFWQRLIVVSSFLVGLALMGGLFTTLASLYALLYSAILVLSIGLGFLYMWIPFVAFALLFTGGRSLSLDYYLMPWLKKKWKNAGWVKKWYLYID